MPSRANSIFVCHPAATRVLVVAVLAIMLATTARGQSPSQREQVLAARTHAVQNLLDEISRANIVRNLSVDEFLRQTEAADELRLVLERAEQIGGPRWVDEQTCQIQLQIAGPRVARALTQIAVNHAKQSPVAPEVVAQLMNQWRHRDFLAVGSSTASGPIVHARPLAASPAWAGVSDEAREAAVTAAKEDAVRKVVESIQPVPLGGDKTLGDAFTEPQTQQAFEDWLTSRPVTRVEFRDDMEVELALAASPDEAVEVIRSSLAQRNDIPMPQDDAGWQRLREQLDRRMHPPVGRGAVPGTAQTQEAHAAIVIPRVPAWAAELVDAQATVASAGSSKLRAARDAESQAMTRLHEKVQALPLTDDLTVGEAAHQDPRIAAAVDRAMRRARVAKADYLANGDVSIRVYMDLRDLWSQIQLAM